jgi:hypothetical protein
MRFRCVSSGKSKYTPNGNSFFILAPTALVVAYRVAKIEKVQDRCPLICHGDESFYSPVSVAMGVVDEA